MRSSALATPSAMTARCPRIKEQSSSWPKYRMTVSINQSMSLKMKEGAVKGTPGWQELPQENKTSCHRSRRPFWIWSLPKVSASFMSFFPGLHPCWTLFVPCATPTLGPWHILLSARLILTHSVHIWCLSAFPTDPCSTLGRPVCVSWSHGAGENRQYMYSLLSNVNKHANEQLNGYINGNLPLSGEFGLHNITKPHRQGFIFLQFWRIAMGH